MPSSLTERQSADMKEAVRFHLGEIEDNEHIRIFYACESGSRAWGFPSADSDYDVRFLYVRPLAWYLSIDDKRDVIELPIHEGLDISGWDLKKALQLLRKSNPPLLEWIGSPIVYLEEYSITPKFRECAREYYSPAACLHHYWHMARGNFRSYLTGTEVWVKKYFYVLRPILAINWIEKGYGIVPTDFNVLVDKLVAEPNLKTEIKRLLAHKRAGAELERGPRIEAISGFIERELERLEQPEIPGHEQNKLNVDLDDFFRQSIAQAWQF